MKGREQLIFQVIEYFLVHTAWQLATCGSSPADGGLAEDVAVERAEGEADVGLREAELDPPLLELLGERLQVI